MSSNRMKPEVLEPSLFTDKADTVIDARTHSIGTLTSRGNVRIDGTAEGAIDIQGDLLVSESARVLATIKARKVYVFGLVKGTISAMMRLEIAPIGKVWGDIRTAALHIEPDSFFQGQCTMASGSDEPLLLDASQSDKRVMKG
jgi:cytoskeletal protein CcmA (bactofilin family)